MDKILIYIVAATCLLLLRIPTVQSSTTDQLDPELIIYDGSKASFNMFVEKYNLDWPVPDTIGYFNNGEIRYANWKPSGDIVGTVVHFNGRTEFIERNISTYKDLLERNYEIWTLDWRGQGLSVRSHDQVGYIENFDDYISDAEMFIKDIVGLDSRPGRKILLAHSMGGQIAMRYLLKHQDTFDSAVMSSPLLALPTIQGEWHSKGIQLGNILKTWFLPDNTCILGGSPEWQGEFANPCRDLENSASITDEQLANKDISPRIYSHNYNTLNTMQCMTQLSIGSADNRDLRVSCATSAWTRQAVLSINQTMDNKLTLKTPTLIMASDEDQAVSNAGQEEFCSKDNKNCCLKIITKENKGGKYIGVDISNEGKADLAYKQAGHELLIEEEPVREVFLNNFFAFADNPVPAKFCSEP